MLRDWARHFAASSGVVSGSCARRRQSFALLRGGDEHRGEIGLGGVGGNEAADAGDGGAIAPGEIVRAVGKGRRQGEAERADEVVIGVGGKLVGRPPVTPRGGRGWGDGLAWWLPLRTYTVSYSAHNR